VAQKLCRYCALEMDRAATVCPHCHRDRKTGFVRVPSGDAIPPLPAGETVPSAPPMSTSLRVFGYFLIVLVLIYFAYCSVMVQRVMH